ncbi:hypothetical protein IV102_25805 [bacterium]|nr:hypothetical protein [bacterium]
MDAINRKDWTVLVYQGGVNNLDPSLQANLRELARGPHPANVDVVVRQFDRTGQRRDYQIDERGLTPLGEVTTEADSANPAQLAQFLKMGISSYPARHYMVVLSSHGRGAEGLIEDERSGGLISLAQLRQALEVGRDANGGKRLDLIFFDACRMQAVEVASEIQSTAEVAVGSMDRIGSAGFDPKAMLEAAANSAAGPELASRLVNDTGPRQLDTFGSMSAIRLDQTGPLELAFAELSQALLGLDAEAGRRVREVSQQSRRSLPSPTYLDGLDNMAYSIKLHPKNSAEELQDWLEQTRPSDPVSILSLCQNLLGDRALMEAHPRLEQAVRQVNEAHAQAVLAERGESLSVLMPIESAQSGPVLSFDEKTQWPRAVHHIVPTGSPANLPPTWLKEELEGR